MEKNPTVVVNNKIVRAKFGKLTDVESRFMFLAIAQIKYTDTDFQTYKFKVGTLLKHLNIASTNYTFLLGVLKSIIERSITIADEKGATIYPWFQKAHVGKNGDVEVRFNEDLRPYLLELRNNFTQAELSHLLNMKVHTRRIYLMCKQYLSIGKFEKNVAELRAELELGKSYESYKFLNREILQPAIKEINELSDIQVAMEPIKEGRFYVRLGIKVWSVPKAQKSALKQIAQQKPSNSAAATAQAMEELKRREECKEKRFEQAEYQYLHLPKDEQKKILQEALQQSELFPPKDAEEERIRAVIHYINTVLGGHDAWYGQ